MASSTPLCADTARERGDAMQGTALNVRRFLLIEHHGPWGFDALESSGIDVAMLGQLLGARTTSARGRCSSAATVASRRRPSGPGRWQTSRLAGSSGAGGVPTPT